MDFQIDVNYYDRGRIRLKSGCEASIIYWGQNIEKVQQNIDAAFVQMKIKTREGKRIYVY